MNQYSSFPNRQICVECIYKAIITLYSPIVFSAMLFEGLECSKCFFSTIHAGTFEPLWTLKLVSCFAISVMKHSLKVQALLPVVVVFFTHCILGHGGSHHGTGIKIDPNNLDKDKVENQFNNADFVRNREWVHLFELAYHSFFSTYIEGLVR